MSSRIAICIQYTRNHNARKSVRKSARKFVRSVTWPTAVRLSGNENALRISAGCAAYRGLA